MSHVIEISDQAYRTLLTLASEQGQTPAALIESWAAQQAQAEAKRDPHTDPRYYTFEEFFRSLGVSEERIRKAEAEAENDADV